MRHLGHPAANAHPHFSGGSRVGPLAVAVLRRDAIGICVRTNNKTAKTPLITLNCTRNMNRNIGAHTNRNTYHRGNPAPLRRLATCPAQAEPTKKQPNHAIVDTIPLSIFIGIVRIPQMRTQTKSRMMSSNRLMDLFQRASNFNSVLRSIQSSQCHRD